MKSANLEALAAAEERWEDTTRAMLDLVGGIIAMKMARLADPSADDVTICYSVADLQELLATHDIERIFDAKKNSFVLRIFRKESADAARDRLNAANRLAKPEDHRLANPEVTSND